MLLDILESKLQGELSKIPQTLEMREACSGYATKAVALFILVADLKTLQQRAMLHQRPQTRIRDAGCVWMEGEAAKSR